MAMLLDCDFLHWAVVPLFKRSCVILYVSDPGMIMDMSHCTSSELGKPIYLQKSRKPLFGGGILKSNGAIWAYERKNIAPELFMENIKVMVGLIVEASVPLLEAWESMLDNSGGSRDIDVDEYLRSFSADVIVRACFGSDFATEQEILCKLRQLQKSISQQDTLVGLSVLWKYLPTKSNKEIRELEREASLLILDIEAATITTVVAFTLPTMTFCARLLRALASGPTILVSLRTSSLTTARTSASAATRPQRSPAATWCLMLLASRHASGVASLCPCRGRGSRDHHGVFVISKAVAACILDTEAVSELLSLYTKYFLSPKI
ncbi:hypothetical protein QYE76_065070 [Lolium multiflorum]|uniref:Uncharacterized protein n=1 Tax=Lolium multiflorum TaxID=4521 RepID=A0AAD8SA75_LOLMU|nr:hypothetical protein QYE76_065070 [Lolium multiflorum]